MEHFSGKDKITAGENLIKLVRNTYGIENDLIMDIAYFEIAKLYHSERNLDHYFTYKEKAIFFNNK